jgi:osmotically-inducible protein OsmY
MELAQMKHNAMYRFVFTAATAAMFVSHAPARASETDDRIESSFNNTYVAKTYLRNDAIKTEARNGVVTLTGQVSESSHKYLAQEAAASLPGVQRVDNRLAVKLEGTDKSDTWIRAKVRSILALHRTVSGSCAEVDISAGVITLRGVAANVAQKELATEYTEDIQGVLRVTNVMTVAAASTAAERTVAENMDDASITAQVKMALCIHRSTSSIKTKVEARAGEITLTGTAKNAAEKHLVTKLVTDIRGVTNVKNEMTIDQAKP